MICEKLKKVHRSENRHLADGIREIFSAAMRRLKQKIPAFLSELRWKGLQIIDKCLYLSASGKNISSLAAILAVTMFCR